MPVSDLPERLARLRPHLDATWTEERARRVAARVSRRRRNRRLASVAAAAAATTVLVVGGLVRNGTTFLSPAPAEPVVRLEDPLARFADGSRVDATSAGTTVAWSRQDDLVWSLELLTGSVRCAVAGDAGPAPQREVRVGSYRVLGSGAFVVERREASANVHVEAGSVSLVGPDDETSRLEAGSTRSVPLRASDLEPASPPEARAEAGRPNPPPIEPTPRAARGADDVRELARQGRFDEAYQAAEAGGLAARADDVDTLLLVADVARRGGHPAGAALPLGRIVRERRDDPRAPAAAFALGRLTLDELGRPKDAAESFADCRRLAPSGPLSEDALAREVEARARAGDGERARALAVEYATAYPYGRRLADVQRHGGLPR